MISDNYQIFNDDCIKIMQTELSKPVDLILTDLPYGVTKCKWDSVLNLDDMWNCVNSLVEDDTPIVFFCNQPFTTKLINSNIKNFKYCWTWDKHIPSGMSYAKYRPMQQTEDIAVFTKKGGKSKYYPQMIKREKPIKGGGMKNSKTAYTDGYVALKKTYDYKNPVTLIKFNKIRQGSVHPTQKPVELLEYLIKTYTKENETVLDFTMGSGSTGVACMNTNRKFIGIEIDENYFNIATDRIKQAYQNNNIQEDT